MCVCQACMHRKKKYQAGTCSCILHCVLLVGRYHSPGFWVWSDRLTVHLCSLPSYPAASQHRNAVRADADATSQLLTTMDCHPPFAAAARRHPRSILLFGPFLSIILLSSTAKYFSASAYNMPKDKIKK